MKIRAIGTTVFAVHRKYVREKITGGRIIVCRVRTYANEGGRISIILRESGNKHEFSSRTHRIYHKLADAIIAISTTKKKR
jgi:hypothetical protein